eukprot:SM000013S26397  [mRNA]  locus=s13:116263:117406:- [translate_table: standard]
MQSPHPELLAKKVDEAGADGRVREVDYVRSAAYVEHLLDAVCSSGFLGEWRRAKDWLGRSQYEYDNVPRYGPRASLDTSFSDACEALVQGSHRPQLKKALLQLAPKYNLEVVQALTCSVALQACAWKRSMMGSVRAFLEEALVHEPALILQLLPLLVVLASLPFLVAPSVIYFLLSGHNGDDTSK